MPGAATGGLLATAAAHAGGRRREPGRPTLGIRRGGAYASVFLPLLHGTRRARAMNDIPASQDRAAPRYDFRAAEPRWQAAWEERGCFAVPDVPPAQARKYYVLEMFPYP